MLKLKMLWLYLPNVRDWYWDVWRAEESWQICCSGRECGCQGACKGDEWEWAWKQYRSRRP